MAVSTSGFYLSMNIGSMFGVSIASLLITEYVKRTLSVRFADLPNGEEVSQQTRYISALTDHPFEIVRWVTSDLDNIGLLHGKTRETVIHTYTESLVHVWRKSTSHASSTMF